MKNICLNFRLHSDNQLSNYPFSLIGRHIPYFDETKSAGLFQEIALKSLLPANRLFADLIAKFKNKFQVSFSISGQTLDLMEKYVPDILKGFKNLGSKGLVEFTAEPYYHSLAALQSKHEFIKQVKIYEDKIFQLLGKRPITFRNTELIHSTFIGNMLYDLGYKHVMVESNKGVLKGRSTNQLFQSSTNEKLFLLVRNKSLSEDISERFGNESWSEWPLTADKYLHWLEQLPDTDHLVNIWMDMTTLGMKYPQESGIMDFFSHFITKAIANGWRFILPSASSGFTAKASLSTPNPISIRDATGNTNVWLANDMQQEAFYSLYQLEQQVMNCGIPEMVQTWRKLQSSDHFYYMNTLLLKNYRDMPYKSPFEAFINYMNVLSDFKQQLESVNQNQKSIPIDSGKKENLPVS